ncbi:MAG: hypothetical protein ACPGPS_04045 [Rubripirellula sp.]
MSDALERAIDNMADELAAMGKAMSRDSKRIEQLQAENERLRRVLEFYADPESYLTDEHENVPIDGDGGFLARAAMRVQLEQSSEPFWQSEDGANVKVVELAGVGYEIWYQLDTYKVAERAVEYAQLVADDDPVEKVLKWCASPECGLPGPIYNAACCALDEPSLAHGCRHEQVEQVSQPDGIMAAIANELARAEEIHPLWPEDPIHATAIIAEELGELQRAVLQKCYERQKAVTVPFIQMEAIQIGAMVVRFLRGICDYKYDRCRSAEYEGLEEDYETPQEMGWVGSDGLP